MKRQAVFYTETWRLKEPFHISRGVRTEATVTVAEITADGHVGRGESVPYAHYGESAESVLEEMQGAARAVEAGCSREDLLALMPPGAARNAIDCALWELEAKHAGNSVYAIAGVKPAKAPVTALTIGIGGIEEMVAKARILQDCGLLKVKLNGDDVVEKVRAIKSVAPTPRMIVDPNESWDLPLLSSVHEKLAELGVDMLEQPLPAGQDGVLDGFTSAVPLCADESCHTRGDLAALRTRYDVVNIKLDKTGGLTEALALKRDAEAMGFRIMVGCMIGTSLAMAPALVLADGAEFIDLDGPVWMAKDRDGGLLIRDGNINHAAVSLWG
ncbi:N-acetyl-D-Glu racemase DgcA [Kordiimonas aestuarii]|uniref:N-acetyl-D-Glu racemase DgcA n=1 Tax=Kordiimonas aestuarii TaxID=1005925 RepID=UPI0021CE78EE|nr:N-acetyl-D-Glu racemase DgcA [Kordiimonas aestuarii]